MSNVHESFIEGKTVKKVDHKGEQIILEFTDGDKVEIFLVGNVSEPFQLIYEKI